MCMCVCVCVCVWKCARFYILQGCAYYIYLLFLDQQESTRIRNELTGKDQQKRPLKDEKKWNEKTHAGRTREGVTKGCVHLWGMTTYPSPHSSSLSTRLDEPRRVAVNKVGPRTYMKSFVA